MSLPRARGILHGDGAPERFTLRRVAPSPGLVEIVDSYWITRWDLTGLPPHRQEVLPHPCIHVVVERGNSGAFGISTGKFVKELAGEGRAVGIKFWPGAFRSCPPADLSPRGTLLGDVWGDGGRRYEQDMLATDDEDVLVASAEAFVARHCPRLDEDARLARCIVEAIAAHPGWSRVEAVGEAFGLSVRALQRLFARRVGVSPKWVLQRYRMHEAVEQLEAGEDVDLASLAGALGYFDQAHFVRDFTRLVGRPPGRYRAALGSSDDGS